MSCGMVRKIDELGRVVLPKEMRRILNINTGSSVEMNINEDNKIVISKFSEIENIKSFFDVLGKVIFDNLEVSCILCDDEKIVNVFGESKKEYLHKKLLLNSEKLKRKSKIKFDEQFVKLSDLVENCKIDIEVSIFFVESQGFVIGYIFVFKDNLTNEKTKQIELLIELFSKMFN